MNLQDRIQDIVNEIQNTLGYGHTPEIYQTAITVALQEHRIAFEINKTIPITFHDRYVGSLTVDIIVDYRLVIMICGDIQEKMNRCITYKRMTNIPYGMILMFTSQGPIIQTC